MRTLVGVLPFCLMSVATAPGHASPGEANDGSALERAIVAYESFAYDSALEILRHALAEPRGSERQAAELHAVRGLVLFVVGKRSQAEAAFRRALELDLAVELPEAVSPKISAHFQGLKDELELQRASPAVLLPPSEVLPEPDPVAGVADLPRPVSSAPSVWTWVTAGGGGASLIAGAVLGVQAQENAEKSRQATFGDATARLASRAEEQQLAANVLFAAAGTLVVSAVVLYLLESDS